MAGTVTGSIGSNDVLLKNMATEETLFQILEALSEATVTPGTPAQKKKDDKDQSDSKKENTRAVKSSTKAFEGIFKGMEGVGRVIRGLDSNINNASWAFQAMSRGTGAFSKAMEFAANSVSQLQEQFNAYGKMMQIGGVVTDDFGKLSLQANELGTDLQGLVKFTTEYGASLKQGSTSVADTLTKMRGQFKQLSDDQIVEYGRLGVGITQITEQMLLTAESQGGYNSVLAKYKGSTKDMNAGMLKSTQELNIFASAIGMNSRMMQEEAAKAAGKIENKLFMQGLTDAERNQVTALQALTNSYEGGLAIMRAMKTGFVDEQAAQTMATMNIAGLGKEFKNMIDLLGKGKPLADALKESGLIEGANKISDQQIQQWTTNMKAFQAGGQPEVAQSLGNFLSLIANLKGTTPENIDKRLKDITAPFNKELPKTIDSYSKLLQEQNTLAQSTAALNTQINRLGLSFALAGMKSTNAVVKAGSFTKENILAYFKELGIDIPPNIMENINNVLEGKVQGDIQGQLLQLIDDARKAAAKATSTTTGNEPPPGGRVTLRNGATNNTAVPVKMANGTIQYLNASDLVENRGNIQATTNAFGGANNNAGTVATGAMLASRIPTISALTAGSDKYHAEKAPDSRHNKGMALDFGIATRPGEKVNQTAQATIEAMHGLMKEYGFTAGTDYNIADESTPPDGPNGKNWTGPHIHMDILRPEVSNKMRELFQQQMKPKDEKLGSNTMPLGDGTAVTQVATEQTDVKVTQAGTSNVVNTDNRDSIVVTALEIHGDKIVNQFKQSARDIVEAVLNA